MKNAQPPVKRQLLLYIIAIIGMFIGIYFTKTTLYPNEPSKTLLPHENQALSLSGSTPIFGTIYATSSLDALWGFNTKGGKIHVGKEVSEGETIQTGTSGFVEIQLGQNSLLRLNTDTKIEFRPNKRIQLIQGSIWLRSVTNEESGYRIDSGEIEATITSTAVALEKFESGAILTFIDSGLPNGEIAYEALTESGSIQGTLQTEESFTLKAGVGKKKKENMDRLLGQTFYAYSLKKDLIFLSDLEKKYPNELSNILRKKIESEIESSLPSKAEIEKFFLTSVIRDEVRQFIRYNPQYGSGNLTTNSLSSEEEIDLLISCIRDDLEFAEMKIKLKQMREGQGFMTPEEKEIFQIEVNTLEESIKDFEKNWSEKQGKRRKSYLLERRQKNEIITATEGGASNITPIIPAQDWIRTTSGPAIVSGSAKK